MVWFLKRVIKSGLQRLHDIRRRIQYQMAVAPDGFPIPPAELHLLVSGRDGLDLAAFFDIGSACADGVVRLVTKHGVDIEELGAILDFGCGCGRVIRRFHSLKRAKLYGTDYNPKMVDWCRRNLPFAEFEINGLSPPLVYGDGSFGLIYAFSVFTHLSEGLQVSWLAELSRVLKPGGYLVLTTHGTAYADAGLPPREKERFRSGELIVVNEGASGENACAAYHPVAYVQKSLAKGFELLEYVPGEVVNASQRLIAQDAYLLKKS
jgi:SAM-dependent methyltransferase